MGRIGEKLNFAISKAIEIIKDTTTCFEVARYLGKEVKGGFVRCKNERTPSCHLKDHSFYCYSCNKGGDVISFYMHETGLDFMTALKAMDIEFGCGILRRALTEAEEEEVRRKIEARERKKRRAVFWGRETDLWRSFLVSQLRTQERLCSAFKPKRTADLARYSETTAGDIYFSALEAADYLTALLDCLDEMLVETPLDDRFGYAFDKKTAKERHFRVLRALSDGTLSDII